MAGKVKVSVAIGFFVCCVGYASFQVISLISKGSLRRGRASVPYQSVADAWKPTVERAPGTPIENTKEFAEWVNKHIPVETYCVSGEPKPEMLSVAQALPGALVLGMGFANAGPLSDLVNSQHLKTRMTRDTFKRLRDRHPSSNWVKIDLSKSYVLIFDKNSKDIPTSVSKTELSILQAANAGQTTGPAHAVVYKFHVIPQDGGDLEERMFLNSTAAGEMELLSVAMPSRISTFGPPPQH